MQKPDENLARPTDNLRPAVRPNSRRQAWLGGGFLAVVVLGIFFPLVGISILACMLIGLSIATRSGRSWCGTFCPRGAFLDSWLAPISRQAPLPKFFSSYVFRLIFIAILFSFLMWNIVRAWPDPTGIAAAFVRTLLITSAISIVFGMIWRARAWCWVCPVGTFSGIIGGHKKQFTIDTQKCTSCTNCSRVCPMGITPHADRNSCAITSPDCIRCQTCVANCPTGAIRPVPKPEKNAAKNS